MIIPFNIPFTTNNAIAYIKEAFDSGQISGNGSFTGRCQKLLASEWGNKNALLTSSCTDALEISAILLDIKPGDEVIVPSYTFVSTALAFKRQGATIVFADSRDNNPCIDEEKIEKLITEKTKAIVPVHYAGISSNMDRIMDIAGRYKLKVVEDAAHAFGSKYKGRYLGTIGHLGCYSFHETKIVQCGEGGMLSVNDNSYVSRAELVWEKGTNRAAFHRGEVRKYEWLDTGSSFLMSDITAAYLYSQIEEARNIISHRKCQWEHYYNSLKELEASDILNLPSYPSDSEINYSGFYIITRNKDVTDKLRLFLNARGFQVLLHYLDLSQSPYILKTQKVMKDNVLINSRRYQDTLLRLPLFYDLPERNIDEITASIKVFFKNECR
jgi:dTDP-4-amino-4,6-dideoxygalactose transaminase